MAGLIWIGHRGSDGAMLASIAPLRAILCCDWDADLSALSREIPISSVEQLSLKRLPWSSASLHLIGEEALHKVLLSLPNDELLAVVPYRSTHWMEKVVASFPQVCLAGPPAELVEILDDKIFQRQLFSELGLPTPRWRAASADQLGEITRLGNIGFPAVIQKPRGSLGIGTFRVESPEELQRLNLGKAEKLLVSEFLSGPVVNATAVVGRDDVYLGWPSVQLVGLPSCAGAGEPFRYCGNDFGATSSLPPAAIQQLFSLIRTLAGRLRRLGFLGIFGTDWIFNDGHWVILELNPRFQGSTLCLTNLERETGILPLVVEHLRAFLPESVIPETRRRPPMPEPLMGGQVVLYQRHGEWVKVGDSVSQLPDGDNADTQRWKMVGGPIAGTEVASGSVLARACTPENILDSCLDELTPHATEAARILCNFLVSALGNGYIEVVTEREQ